MAMKVDIGIPEHHSKSLIIKWYSDSYEEYLQDVTLGKHSQNKYAVRRAY